MPIDPGFGERLAHRVAELFAEAELAVLRRISRALARGLDEPDWATTRLTELEWVRAQIARDVASLDEQAAVAIGDVIRQAYTRGRATAVTDLDALGLEVVVPPATLRAVEAIAAETVARVGPWRPRILRAAQDVYQRTVAEASATVLLGSQARRDAAQQALDRLTERGVGTFRDRSGRRWALESYVEMAVRTGAGGAAIDGHTTQLVASGVDLVVVSDAPRECPLCRPWEGKVLSIGGGLVGTVEVPSAVSDRPVSVRVAGTVAQARAAGFQHPNCRHSLSAYLPGATRVQAATSERAGYEDQQRQRAIERGIRKWKLREAVSLDDVAAASARTKVQAWQRGLRAHLAEHPELKRQTAREQVSRAR
ncbi:capsid protein [Cellulosimicrobium terreum]|nr:capsid protein [Cellulosimicrobium terreum]